MNDNSQKIYNKMDKLAVHLRSKGCFELADRLFYRVHKAVYTTRSEILEELRTFLVNVLESVEPERLPQDLVNHIQESIVDVQTELDAYTQPNQ